MRGESSITNLPIIKRSAPRGGGKDLLPSVRLQIGDEMAVHPWLEAISEPVERPDRPPRGWILRWGNKPLFFPMRQSLKENWFCPRASLSLCRL